VTAPVIPAMVPESRGRQRPVKDTKSLVVASSFVALSLAACSSMNGQMAPSARVMNNPQTSVAGTYQIGRASCRERV